MMTFRKQVIEMLRRRPPSTEDDVETDDGDTEVWGATGIRSPNKTEQKPQANATIIGRFLPHSALFCCGGSMTSEWKKKNTAPPTARLWETNCGHRQSSGGRQRTRLCIFLCRISIKSGYFLRGL